MKLLLHICCAPCLIYPLNILREKSYDVEGFFYNPNIHPFSEYSRRRQAVEEYQQSCRLKVDFPDYLPQEFFREVHQKEESPQRCANCWKLRLRETAKAAKEKCCGFFTTTLLVSPYQDQGALREVGEDAARAEGVAFFYQDFRPGFRKAHDEARAKGMYCQRYCGCLYSQIERYSKKSIKDCTD